MEERIAAIDVGSNTAGYLAAERRGGTLSFGARQNRFVRLSEGLQQGGGIAPAAELRMLEWAAQMAAELSDLGVERVRAVGTEVLRRAANSGEVRVRIESVLGVPVQVISGEEEARLTWSGVRFGYPQGPLAVLDIGGASSEVMLGAESGAPQVLSVPVGAVTLTDRCGEDWPALQAAVARVLEGFEVQPQVRGAAELTTLGGTGQNLAMMDRGRKELTPEEMEGHCLARPRADELRRAAAALSPAERVTRLGIPPGRADILIAGLAILDGVLEHLGIAAVRATTYALRHGVLWSMLPGNG